VLHNQPLLLTNAGGFGSGRCAAAFYIERSQQNAKSLGVTHTSYLGQAQRMERQFEYDVALSFCYEDEAKATEIADRLRDRVRVFLYSEQQKKLVGRDGEEEFSRVYSEKARTVAVLYRPKWGTTPFTRIEETAIRNRAFEEGYGFTTFISLDDSSVPKWLPKPRIWLGIGREGSAGAAAILEARVVEAGGEAVEETAEDHAIRLARQVQKRLEMRNWLRGPEAMEAAVEEVDVIVETLGARTRALQEKQTTVRMELEVTRHYGALAVLRTPLASAIFGWTNQYSNSLEGAALTVGEYKGAFLLNRRHDETLPRIAETQYQFAVSDTGERGWMPSRDETQFYTSASLVDHHFKRLFVQFAKLSRARERP